MHTHAHKTKQIMSYTSANIFLVGVWRLKIYLGFTYHSVPFIYMSLTSGYGHIRHGNGFTLIIRISYLVVFFGISKWNCLENITNFKDQVIGFRHALANGPRTKWSRSKWSYPGYKVSSHVLRLCFIDVLPRHVKHTIRNKKQVILNTVLRFWVESFRHQLVYDTRKNKRMLHVG